MRNSGLRVVEGVGGAGERPALGDLSKDGQTPKIEHEHKSYCYLKSDLHSCRSPRMIARMKTLMKSPTRIPGHTGEVVTPDHPGYDSIRAVFNGSIDRRPALIARATSASDVQAALRFARAGNLPFTTRAGGHSLAGFSTI